MIRFVNIKTRSLYEFESWDWVRENGGLRSQFPASEYDDIYNEAAVQETLSSFIPLFHIECAFGNPDSFRFRDKVFTKQQAQEFIQPYFTASDLFAMTGTELTLNPEKMI